MKRLQLNTAPWTNAKAPGIAVEFVPAHVARALLAACRALDKDVELTGAASVETVEQVRAALALLHGH
jgi:hypothetical protein